ncbi:MAG TPA: nucleoside deaminase [Candidatus Nanoarchaeia archaeon]|nr:nucleoside deaminase [Candidatus Nanoarchaeia archaeon]
MNNFMRLALSEAVTGMRRGDGGHFGAVIVKGDKVIAKAHNMVLKSNDPTSHSELVAIRKASKKLGRFDLSDCIIYSSSEPCPMCLGAILWAKIKTVYFGCTKEDTSLIGFSDKSLYDELKGAVKSIKLKSLDRDDCLSSYAEWQAKKRRFY